MTTDFRTEDEQRAWLEALVVGDRVTHSSADARGIAGTVTATDDPEHQMGDIRVQWDAPLPWLKGNFDADHGWHSPGFCARRPTRRRCRLMRRPACSCWPRGRSWRPLSAGRRA